MLSLRTVGLERIFDGLGAPCFISFQFRDYAANTIGEDPTKLRQFAIRFPLQCPSLQLIEVLRAAFRTWEAHSSLCAVMSALLAGTCLKKESSWPLGHVLLLPGRGPNNVCYIGADAPKLLILVNAARPQTPEVYVVEATAYHRTIQLGKLPIACQQSWPDTQLQPDVEFSIEYRDGQGVLNVGAYHCQQEGCLTCFLAGCLHQLRFCPWHLAASATEERGPLSIAHFFCTKNPNNSTVDLVGQLADSPRASAVYLFHVCTMEQIHQLGPQLHLFLLIFPGQETPRRYRSYIRSFTDKNRYYNSCAATDMYTCECIQTWVC